MSNGMCVGKFNHLPALEIRNSKINPELIGWVNLITKISNTYPIATKKIGIVVDSELDKIFDINKREKPIYDTHYLPENIELIYASSDVGKEFATNKIISACDYISKHVLKKIEEIGGKTQQLMPSQNVNYDFEAYWNIIIKDV